MQINCPHCGKQLALPHELLRKGVVRTACSACGFPFVARLGTPSTGGSEERDPTLPIYLEGVTSSTAQSEAAGEIGPKLPAFIPADTRTRVVLDDSLKSQVKSLREGGHQAGPPNWVAASTLTMQPPNPQPRLHPGDTEQLSNPGGWAGQGLKELATDVSATPQIDLVGTPTDPQEGSAEYEALNPVSSARWAAPNAPAAVPVPNAPAAVSVPAALPVPNGPAAASVPAAVSVADTDPSGLRPAPAVPLPPSFPASPVGPMSPPSNQVVHPSTLGNLGLGQDTVDPWRPVGQSRAGAVLRGIGVMISVGVFGSMVFGLFVLSRNDWSLDPSRLDIMLHRALKGGAEPVPRELANLETSAPIIERMELADGRPVVTAEGVVKNKGSAVRRFIYLRAKIMRGHRVIASASAPAGNLFRRSELARLTTTGIDALINPAGRQGRNAKVEPGESVAYMVVFTNLPPGFVLADHSVVAQVSRAEFDDGR